jgi:acyl-coenzyme A synthetase/AMP-(fatty) acid ligase/acyl carrier protein
LQFASLTFDTAVEEIFPTLAAGATLVLRDDAMLASPQAFVQKLAEARITVLNVPTSYWHQLAAGAGSIPPHVRLTLVGGEAMRSDCVARWRQLAPESRLLNGYGLTEGTVVTTFADLTASVDASDPVNIGRPIWNSEAYVLDASGTVTGDGLAGELFIGGIGLARGYRGDTELTKRRFVPHPFKPGERLYRTGDRVRRRSGRLEYLGRLDEQIKVHGFRVDPEEIAVCLRGHPLVADAVVLSRGPADDRSVAAWLAVPDGVPLSAAAVRAHVRRELPEYMVPAALFRVSTLPRSASGKLDRSALGSSEPLLDAPDAREPSTVSERIVAAIWSELLGAPAPGIRENFFDLGGHSLVAARMAARLQEAFGVDVPLRTIFERPTIADLAAFIDHAALDSGRGAAAAIPRLDRRRYRASTPVEAAP